MSELTSLHQKFYGLEWCKNPPDPERCAKEVWSAGRGSRPHQCNRKRGFGPEGAYCKQHSPDAKAERDRKAQVKFELDMWRRWERDAFKVKIAQAAIDMLHQKATIDDLERAVSEYEAKCAEIETLRATQ